MQDSQLADWWPLAPRSIPAASPHAATSSPARADRSGRPISGEMGSLRRRNSSEILTPAAPPDAINGGRTRHGPQRSNKRVLRECFKIITGINPLVLAGTFALAVLCILGMWASSTPTEIGLDQRNERHKEMFGRHVERDERHNHQQRLRTKFHKKPPLEFELQPSPGNEEGEEDGEGLELGNDITEDYDYDYGSEGIQVHGDEGGEQEEQHDYYYA